MKKTAFKITAVAALTLAASMLHGADNADPKARAKRRLALRSAAKQTLEMMERIQDSSDVDMGQLSGRLSEMMLKEISIHRRPQQSKQTVEEYLRQSREDKFESELDKIVARAEEHSPLELDRQDVLSQLNIDWRVKRDAAVRSFMLSCADQLFKSGREKAVALQKERISQLMDYPSFEALDMQLLTLYGEDGKPVRKLGDGEFATLQKWLKGTSLDSAKVLQEVEQHASGLADKMTHEIRAQYNDQIKRANAIADNLSQAFVTAGGIKDKIAAELSAGIKVSQSVPPVYPVFSVVEEYIAALAENIERERFVEFIEKSEVLNIGPDRIEEMIQRQIQSHINYDQSLEILKKHFQAELEADLIGLYLKEVEAKKGDQAKAELKPLLADGQPAAKRIGQRVENEIKSKLPQVRAEVASAQVAEYFPVLMRDWDSTGVIAEWLYDNQKSKAANLDDAIMLLQFLPDVEIDAPREQLLDETRERVMRGVNSRVEPAAKALGSQLRIIGRMEEDNLDLLKEWVAAGTGFKEILKEWKWEWQKRWKEIEFSQQFPEMFPRAREQLEKTVRQLYDSVSQELEQEKVQKKKLETGTAEPSEQKESAEQTTEVDVVEEKSQDQGEETLGEEVSEGMSPGFSEMVVGSAGHADCIFLFDDRPDGRCSFEFGTPDESVQKTFNFSAGEIEDTAEQLATAMEADLLKIAAAKARNYKSGFKIPFFGDRDPPELSVYVRVKSRQLRHLTMLLLRDKLQDRLDSFADERGLPSLDIDWNEWRQLESDK